LWQVLGLGRVATTKASIIWLDGYGTLEFPM
jgi:hypothetical protein